MPILRQQPKRQNDRKGVRESGKEEIAAEEPQRAEQMSVLFCDGL